MKLAAFIQHRELTDEQMAALVREDGTGCDRSTITRLRNGNGWPKRRLAARLMQLCGDDALDGLITGEVA